MKIKERIKEIENMRVGFDISLAERKLNMLDSLLSEIENSSFVNICKISREEIISVLRNCYGISYEIGNTKQSLLNSNKEIELSKRTLSIARLLFGKSKELLPYLNLNLINSISDKELHNKISIEILEIKNQT
ncbi:MAG: hypothetical protein LCH67_14895 [Bacteroidetes bacterium]|nr:hypothetical protein [Bacteroidota bacterium]